MQRKRVFSSMYLSSMLELFFFSDVTAWSCSKKAQPAFTAELVFELVVGNQNSF
jgi:hypothetical protein